MHSASPLVCRQEQFGLLPPAGGVRAGVQQGCNDPILTCLSKILTLDRLNPGDHACKFLLESKDMFQPFSTEDLEGKQLSKIKKEDTATISHDCQSRSLKLNVSIDRIRMLSSQPFYCFTKTQCLNSRVI